MKGWKDRFHSRAQKAVLIKEVAQANSSYIMSCYKLSESVCHELESLLEKFWWGMKENKRKIHLLSWGKLSRAKRRGGLGFRGFSEFNVSFLGKHYWRLLKGENTLVGKVFKSRYFPKCSLEDSLVGFNPNYACRSFFSARDLVLRAARGVDQNTKVKGFINSDLGCWKREFIHNTFDPVEALQIISIPLSQRDTQDKLIWHHEKLVSLE
ncbi:uncharacterized mitochondrial protein AtMg00310-like [Vicia villosa]|uniref:uncharacterized mitochondrial protein AtMg00310-like n=1 Tax=Vicia villosa TaxID=3911 RepID=UPI00273CB4E7|nr:uncharacterized mitochondrial protein AtMg00310-like [Vicia villosa]